MKLKPKKQTPAIITNHKIEPDLLIERLQHTPNALIERIVLAHLGLVFACRHRAASMTRHTRKNMQPKFTYDEKTGHLYAPDGTFLKRLHCPKGMKWSELDKQDNEDRWKSCAACGEMVLNLDIINIEDAIATLKERDVCVYFTSHGGKVTFLGDQELPPAGSRELNNTASEKAAQVDCHRSPKILVVGVGGAGIKAVDHMISQGVPGVQFAAIDTDQHDLTQSHAGSKLKIGSKRRMGLG